MEYVDDGVVKTADIEHNLTIMYDEAYDVAKVVSDSYRETCLLYTSDAADD